MNECRLNFLKLTMLSAIVGIHNSREYYVTAGAGPGFVLQLCTCFFLGLLSVCGEDLVTLCTGTRGQRQDVLTQVIFAE